MSDPFRVMIVDDSAVIRGLLKRGLEADPALTVVASVSNGQQAIAAVTRHDIEIIVLDIEMPVMDGMTALPRLLDAKPGVQIVMASTLTRKNAEISLRAMTMGAAEYVTKPSSTSEIHSADSFKRELVDKIKALAEAGRSGRRKLPAHAAQRSVLGSVPPRKTGVTHTPSSIKLRPAPRQSPDVIAIGSSTGGPQALFEMLSHIGTDIKQPILITQHMPATFTALLAEHITKASKIPASEAKDGELILPGHIYVAPGEHHMVVERGQTGNHIRLNTDPPENFCRPAVDPMLRSMAKIYGSRLLVVILTGMGADGQKGSIAVTEAGGSVIAQDEATSVVWGMPGAVATAGLCSAVLPLPEIAGYVRKLVMRTAA
jgi:two-component system, chemotaxis family, protein-glutamate methylesterase/glutaminase